MHSQSSTVGAALLAGLTATTNRIYQEQAPVTASFPCVVYSESQAPAGHADNAVCANAVTFDMEAYSAGSAWPLAEAVINCMAGIGYTCSAAQSAGMVGDGTIHQISMTFINSKEG